MKYSFTCPPDGAVISTEAANDEEALTKLVKIGNEHMKEFHKDQPQMSDEEMRKLIKSLWTKS